MYYRRISRGMGNYALFPENIDYQTIINDYGVDHDYYDSLYLYDEEQYNKFINNLKTASEYASVSFNQERILDTEKRIRNRLKYLSEKEKDANAQKLISAYSVGGTINVKTNRLVFDFDSENDIEQARRDALELCTRLIQNQVSQDAIGICFSGSKGFSVEVTLHEHLTRKQFERVVSNLSRGLKTFDEKVKDQQRLFRIPLTKHPKSQLFKIPLSLDELSDLKIEDIKLRASNESIKNEKDKFLERVKARPKIPAPQTILSLTEEEQKRNVSDFKFHDRLELSRKPSWMSSTKFALQEGFFEEGNRNEAFMILCATYKTYGFPKEIAYRMLKGVAELQAKRTGGEVYDKNRLWAQVVNSVYNDNWRGGTYSEKETDLLKKTAERFNLSQESGKARLTNLEEGLNRFKVFGENFDKNRIVFNIPELDDGLLITTQMTVGILGAPSSGKTTVAMKMIDGVLASGENVLFHSLDMGEYNIVSRFLSRYCDYSYREILEMLQKGFMDDKLKNAWNIVQTKYKNLGVTYRSGTSVEDIEQDILEFSNVKGKRPKLVVVDYLEKVRGPYSDDTANSGYVASRISDLATEYDTCVVLLLQPQKHAGDPSEPLYSMRKVKGSSKIEQDCRVILTVWRPGFNPEDNKDDLFMQMAVVKNNMGATNTFEFLFDGKSGKIETVPANLESKLKDVIENANERKRKEKSGDGLGY